MPEEIRWVKTHCARMDHGGCALLVGVQGNRIVKVKGDPEGYLNRGYVCPKAFASPERLSHPERLLHPLKRRGKRGEGKWERISWRDAIDEIAGRLIGIRETDGGRAVAFCQGMPKGLEHFVLIRLANVFGSPNVVAVQDVCHAPREVSGIHTCGFYPVADFHHRSETVVLWGSNVTATNEEGAVCSLLMEQVRKGTKLIVVDPRKTDLAERAGLWLRLKPGTDLQLALAMLNVVIEEGLYDRTFVGEWTHGFDDLAEHVRGWSPEKLYGVTRVPPVVIRKAARLYAASRPAAIQWGNPIEHNKDTFHTVRAILCLMALCGNLDVAGGNIEAVEPDVLPLGRFVRAELLPSKRKEMLHAYCGTIPKLMTVPPNLFKNAVLEGIPYPVKGAYVQCANPLMSYADGRSTFEAFTKLHFLAVSEVFMTPTAALADVVLPAATQFEFNDIGHYGLGHGCLLARPKVVDPPGECRPDIDILNELGKAVSSREFWYERYESLLDEVLAPAGLTYPRFVELGCLMGPQTFGKYLSAGFKTPTGKVELSLSQAERLNVSPLPQIPTSSGGEDPDFPLVLTTAKSPYYLHSSYRWVEALRANEPYPATEIHPNTASAHGIREGDEILIQTRRGEIAQIAHLTERVPEGVVYAAYGWWFPEGDSKSLYDWERSNYNLLTSMEDLGKEFGTPDLKGLSCRICRAPRRSIPTQGP